MNGQETDALEAINLKEVMEFSSASSAVRRARKIKEFFIESLLFSAAASSVLVTGAILWMLVSESLPFFKTVAVKDFLFDTEWTPLFAQAHYGIAPLLCGTLLSTFIALTVAVPLGTVAAVFLSEYASPRAKEILKPILELLAGVPTVVYGYFALLFVTPLLQRVFPDLPGFNILSAGLVIGIMIVPYVSSLSEDAMRGVPNDIREASFATGATKYQTAFQVVIPAAFSGLTSAYILAISRALGETMVVAIAAGLQPNLTLNPMQPAATITAFIVQVSLGDLPHGSIGYQSIYVAGLTLLILTLFFNLIGFALRKKFREVY